MKEGLLRKNVMILFNDIERFVCLLLQHCRWEELSISRIIHLILNIYLKSGRLLYGHCTSRTELPVKKFLSYVPLFVRQYHPFS